MGVPIFVVVFSIQAIFITIITIILKIILDRKLIELAIKKVELWEFDNSVRQSEKFVVITHKKISQKYKSRIEKVVREKFDSTTKLSFEVHRRILGGMIIKIGTLFLDVSLKDRLKQAFL